ncbi:fucose-binding lectin II [Burkholderia dolosa]|uniref:fucose-binding lectin II n=1 Tax=Burkholderia dolosa TaxID=152500 RepID=UPI00167F289E|nr:fucose-binding lectin II [Burkholderia dolosa]
MRTEQSSETVRVGVGGCRARAGNPCGIARIDGAIPMIANAGQLACRIWTIGRTDHLTKRENMGNPINYGDSVWVVDMSIGNGSNTYLQSDASITGGTTSLWQIESYNGESGQVSTSKGMLLKTTSGYLYATESQQVTIAPFQVADPGFIWVPIVVSGGDGLSTDSQFRLQAGNSKAGEGQYLFLTHGTGRPASLKSDSANGATSDIWVFKVASAAPGPSPTPSPNPTPSPSPTPSPHPTPSPGPTPTPSPTPDPNKGEHPFHVPAGTQFAVTVLLNSKVEQTIAVYLDDDAQPAYQITGTGSGDVNQGTVVLTAKAQGKVTLKASAGGKTSLFHAGQKDIPTKRSYIGVIAIYNGADGDNAYDDALVFFNWPLR